MTALKCHFDVIYIGIMYAWIRNRSNIVFSKVLAPKSPCFAPNSSSDAMIFAYFNSPYMTLLNCNSLMPVVWYVVCLEWKYVV